MLEVDSNMHSYSIYFSDCGNH